jgi:hypothetical protein
MNATSQIAASAETTSATIRLRSAAEDRVPVPFGTCCVFAASMRATLSPSASEMADVHAHIRGGLVSTALQSVGGYDAVTTARVRGNAGHAFREERSAVHRGASRHVVARCGDRPYPE